MFERIGDFPEIGSPHLAQTRRLVHGKHVIIYRADTASAVTII
ncbi:MAG: type II toxin-antitoxin system RelE/ParE family toxin [Sphingomonadales bacterium]|nr:type II toxin-antitoxin system RelE/ParE family toxin [Sphingomonadales bacterium]